MKMKDSGIAWIGEIPQEWEIQKLKFVFNIKKVLANTLGYDVLSVTQNGIKIKDTSSNAGQISMDYSKYQLVDIGDFIMNHMDLLTGWVDCSKYRGVTSPDYRVFKLSDAMLHDTNFFTYFFQVCYQQKIFYGLGQGVSSLGRWRLQTDKFINFEIPISPLPTQQAIANYLDDKCSKIESTIEREKQHIAKLKEYRKSVITEAVTKGLNPSAPMKDSGIEWIGEIPQGWKIRKVKHIAKLQPECDTSCLEHDSLITFLPMECIKQGYFENRKAKFSNLNSSYVQFHNDDILLAKVTPCFENGNIAIAENLYNGFGFGSSEIFVVRSIEIYKKYLFYYFQSTLFRDFAISTMYGAGGLKRVSAHFLRNHWLGYPPLPTQQAIADYLDTKTAQIDNAISKKETLIEKLQEYKKSVIFEAVTGKMEV